MNERTKTKMMEFGEIMESIKKTMGCEKFDKQHGKGASDTWANPKVHISENEGWSNHNPKPYPEIPSDQWPTINIKGQKA